MPFLLPPIDTWEQWAATFDDVRTWRPLVDAICKREGIVYHRIEAPESNTNAVFILDRQAVIKIYSPFWQEFAFERTLMELLERGAAVPMLAIRAAGVFRDRRDWNYLVMAFCTGRPLDELRPEMTQPALLEVAAQTGRMIRRLHAFDPAPLAAIDKGERWDALVGRRRREVLPELIDRGLIVPSIAPELDALLDEALAAPRTATQVVVHGDLNAEHLLLDERDGRWVVSALIDFGDARIGAPDYEWMPLWLGLCNRDAAVLRAFLDAYDPALPTDHRLGRRIAAWTLLHDFGTDAIAELFDHSHATRPAPSLAALQSLVWPAIWPRSTAFATVRVSSDHRRDRQHVDQLCHDGQLALVCAGDDDGIELGVDRFQGDPGMAPGVSGGDSFRSRTAWMPARRLSTYMVALRLLHALGDGSFQVLAQHLALHHEAAAPPALRPHDQQVGAPSKHASRHSAFTSPCGHLGELTIRSCVNRFMLVPSARECAVLPAAAHCRRGQALCLCPDFSV